MGNGSGLISIDIETAPLSVDDIEKAAAQAAANFGRPNLIFMTGMMYPYVANPEFEGTPWVDTSRITKRERAVAKIHTFLNKLGVLKLDEQQFEELRIISIKRLRRAKWAQYKNLKRG